MRKQTSKGSIGQLLIDLTPLLDIIFILLIVVLTGFNTYTQNVNEANAAIEAEANAANEAASAAQAENTALKNQLAVYEDINDYINVVSVYSEFSPTNRRNRTIHVITNSAERTFALTALNPKGWEDCKAYLSELLDAKSAEGPVPMLLSIVDDHPMLYRDEQMIISIYRELAGKYSNLYLQNLTESENE